MGTDWETSRSVCRLFWNGNWWVTFASNNSNGSAAPNHWVKGIHCPHAERATGPEEAWAGWRAMHRVWTWSLDCQPSAVGCCYNAQKLGRRKVTPQLRSANLGFPWAEGWWGEESYHCPGMCPKRLSMKLKVTELFLNTNVYIAYQKWGLET